MTHQIPHDLTCNITPTNQNATRIHRTPLLGSVRRSRGTHQSVTAFVRPDHHLVDRLAALGQSVKQGVELALKKLDKILMATVANQR